ncbi:MAG: serine hydrolase domain-containing protein, partial [Paludibacter sp.]
MKKILIALFAIIYLSINVIAQQVENKIDSLIEKAVQLNRFNGSVLVAKNGKIIFEKAFGYQDVQKNILNSSNTIYQIGSTTKEFTAAVILKLAEQHKLSIDDKLSKYFPDFKRGDEITIRHLLTHTSGIYEILRDHTAFNES